MLTEYRLDIAAEIRYAEKWALSRNPAYYDFEDIGGDCTNFISQCLYAGGAVMNFTPDTGWYYRSVNDRAAAWTGVEQFFRFITSNKGVGPFGRTVPLTNTAVGDVIQLCLRDGCYHSLLVTDIRRGVIFVSAHSYDALDRPLYSYDYGKIRVLHIAGARKWV